MLITVDGKMDLVVPRGVRRRAGIKPGDRVEFKVSDGVISIVPRASRADNEYTPAQRRRIDAQLADAIAEVKAGLAVWPFDSADEMIAHMKSELKKRELKSSSRAQESFSGG